MRVSPPGTIRRRFIGATVALCALRPAPTSAQSALVKPIASDSIYRLAVDSSKYREYSYVYLLNEGIVRYETDGRGVRTYHQIVQVLKQRGVEEWAEHEFSYRPRDTKFKMNWMRVLKPTGELVSDKPSILQESNVPAALSNPVYSDTKVLRYSLSGVAVGTLVDISWTGEITDVYLRGDFRDRWSTTMAYPVIRSRYVVDVPTTITPRIAERHVDPPRIEETAGQRHYYVWAKDNVMPVRNEIFAPDSSVPRMGITVSSPLGWADIAKWYGGLALDRYSLSARATATVDSIARLQRTAADTLRAIHTWIAKDIRYVSVALGLGGYQPRFPDSTIVSGFGDCKDKATLFIAAAHHLGLTAYPVLLNSRGVRDKTLPAIEQFDHLIAAIPRHGTAGYTFLDLTTASFAPGTVPPSYRGEFGLVVLPDGKSEEVTFPEEGRGETVSRFVGEVDDKGRVSGTFETVAHGADEVAMRVSFQEPPDSARRAMMRNSLRFRAFPNGKVDTLIVFDGRDPSAAARIAVTIHDGDGFKRAGSVALLTVPRMMQIAPASLVSLVSTDEPRKYPIDAAEVVGPSTSRAELRLTLPEGWTAELPKGVRATSVFGDFHSEFSQVGREIRMTLQLSGAKGVFPRERFADLRAWVKAVAEDSMDSIVLRPPGGS